MPQSRFSWTLLLLGALFLGSAWILQSQEPVRSVNLADDMVVAPAVGHVAPDFTVSTLTGESFTLSEQLGQPLVLNFWATWCPPCRAEIPYFQAASRKYNGQVTVVGVDDGEPLGLVAPFVSQLGMTYVIPLDEDSAVSKEYRVNSLPTTFFIDDSGVIRYVHIGIINQAVLEDKIAELIDSS
jgi:thiol-disulfide isomerase/thioredoxin